MKVNEIIMVFSQSEKIKAGLIWVSQVIQLLNDLPEPEKQGSEKTCSAMIGMILHEIQVGKNITGDVSWDEVIRHIDRGAIMINSGVASEAVVHLTQALSQVTSLGHRSMSYLKEEGLL